MSRKENGSLWKCADERMPVVKALLSGGPAQGVIETQAPSRDGRVWTVNIVHVNCVCEWCARVDGPAVVHVYERRDDDVFAYRESREPRDGDT